MQPFKKREAHTAAPLGNITRILSVQQTISSYIEEICKKNKGCKGRLPNTLLIFLIASQGHGDCIRNLLLRHFSFHSDFTQFLAKMHMPTPFAIDYVQIVRYNNEEQKRPLRA